MDIFNIDAGDDSSSTNSSTTNTNKQQQTLAAILEQLQSHDERLNALEASANQNQHQSVLSIKGHDDNEPHGNNNDDSCDGLPEDTFTLMMLSPACTSQAWLLGLFTFAFQTVLSFMIAADQLKASVDSSTFNVPFKVDAVVRVGQLFAIIYFMATQDDITSSVRFIVMFWKDPHWDRIILGRRQGQQHASSPSSGGEETWLENIVTTTTTTEQQQQDDNNKRKDTQPFSTKTGASWTRNILIPNILRFLQGSIVNFISFVIIVQSDNIIDLLKDFTALMILSDTDNIFFGLAARGYFGRELQRKSIQARNVEIAYEASFSSVDHLASDMEENLTTSNVAAASAPSSTIGKDFIVRPFILFCITMIMIGSWIYIVVNQVNGVYFDKRYPNCKSALPNAFELATEHFGDGICYGGPLNTLECEFEDGDCINFNTAYPLCKGANRINAQERVGNGKCDAEFMDADCDYDGGDCCPYEIINDPSFGDGICDKEMNTKGCGYDNGDCIDYNRDFAGCPLNLVFENPTFGDGQCNGGIASTERCGYDNGDCNPIRIAYPDCPFDDLAEGFPRNSNVILGDGICDNGIYNTKDCGYNFGDCKQGQVGQRITIPDNVDHPQERILYFSQEFSLDGSTIAFGLFYNGKSGRFNFNASGVVKVLRYNSERKKWSSLGNKIVGDSTGTRDAFSRCMSMSANGNRIAISSNSGLRVFELNSTLAGDEVWNQMGQTLNSRLSFTYGIISADGSRVALVYGRNEIRIYQIEFALDGKGRWIHGDNDAFSPGDNENIRNTVDVELKFVSAEDDSTRLMFRKRGTRVVKIFQQINSDTAWVPMGQNIPSPRSSSMATSASGNRIAVHMHPTTNATSSDAQDEIHVLDYDATQDKWLPVGNPIMSPSPIDGWEFGHSIEMSSDGNFLLIAANSPDCRSIFYQNAAFDMNECTVSLRPSFKLYAYRPAWNQFVSAPLREDVQKTNNIILSDANILHGLHFSMSNGGNGSTLLSVSNYNVNDEEVFVDVFDLDELYYTRCVVDNPLWIGDKECFDEPPYNSELCGFDGGDCEPKPVDGYPRECSVHRPGWIGNEVCNDIPPYNTPACGFDGGDCKRNPVDGYLNCFVHHTEQIGDGVCHDFPPYNTAECGFDGGDCVYNQ